MALFCNCWSAGFLGERLYAAYSAPKGGAAGRDCRHRPRRPRGGTYVRAWPLTAAGARPPPAGRASGVGETPTTYDRTHGRGGATQSPRASWVRAAPAGACNADAGGALGGQSGATKRSAFSTRQPHGVTMHVSALRGGWAGQDPPLSASEGVHYSAVKASTTRRPTRSGLISRSATNDRGGVSLASRIRCSAGLTRTPRCRPIEPRRRRGKRGARQTVARR